MQGARLHCQGVLLLSQEEYMEAVELRRRGWSTARIAQRLGRDRKTVRSYLAGERTPGSRHPARDDFLRFLPYCRQRLADDPHLSAAMLFDEIATLGYPGGYSTLTRALRRHQIRPPCERCQAMVTYEGSPPDPEPTGGAIQFDWLDLPGAPAAWGRGISAHLLVGVTSSGRWRGALAENEELPHLVEAMEHVMRQLGGSTRRWCFDRTPPVYCPRTNRVTPEFSQVAEHYGVDVEICPQGDPRRAACTTPRQTALQWWSTLREGTTAQDAQRSLDQVTARMDRHCRSADSTSTGAGTGPTVAEGLRQLPTPFPLQIRADRIVSDQGLVHFRGNCYAVPHNLPGAAVEVRQRLGDTHLSIATASGAVIARYRIAPRGAGLRVAKTTTIALERPAITADTRLRPCQGQTRRPPSKEALLLADALRRPDPAPPLGPPQPTGTM
jgi:hypothetical protein